MNKADMKIMLVGSGDYRMYENAFLTAFQELGYISTELLAWNSFFGEKKFGYFSELSAKAQNKYHIGPRVRRFNQELIEKCENFQPNMVFIYSGIMVYPKTIRRMKELTDAIVISYNNDDPFAEYYSINHWRYYRESIKECDYNFVYREKNVTDIWNEYGVKAEILRSYYIDEYNHPCSPEELLENVPEVIFLGHFEEDERCEYMQALIDKGITVGVPEEHYKLFRAHVPKVVPLPNNRELYNQYLCSCKIPLIFLSKINHDTYTRRCFEIPAAGAMIFCPYTDDMATMFEEGKEAIYFRNKEEFVSKIQCLLANDIERIAVAEAGRKRLLIDGHEAKDRVKQVMKVYETLIDDKCVW